MNVWGLRFELESGTKKILKLKEEMVLSNNYLGNEKFAFQLKRFKTTNHAVRARRTPNSYKGLMCCYSQFFVSQNLNWLVLFSAKECVMWIFDVFANTDKYETNDFL